MAYITDLTDKRILLNQLKKPVGKQQLNIFGMGDVGSTMLSGLLLLGRDLIHISGINMNKSFILPSPFALLATANAPGTISQVEGIEDKAGAFGKSMREYLYNGIEVSPTAPLS